VTYEFIAVDDPGERVRRITLNRPEKRNAINHGMRAELFDALEAADVDEAVHVTIVRVHECVHANPAQKSLSLRRGL